MKEKGPKAKLDYQRDVLMQQYWSDLDALSRGRRVLLVEGDDDVVVVETLGRMRDPNFETRVVVYPAGDKDRVLRRLRAAANDGECAGLVDRDVWSDDEITKRREEQPGLYVTSGWCLENAFCDADLLEGIFNLTAGSLAKVRAVEAAWHDYGAVRWVVQRAREQFAGCWPAADYGRPDGDKVLDEAALRQELSRLSSSAVDGERILAEIEVRRQALAGRARLAQGVHGKQFFRQVVVPALNRALEQMEERYWRDEIARKWPSEQHPPELVALFESLLR